MQVTGNLLFDTRTPEISTNVTEDQIRYLPQSTRNFLNFAALAPGVRVSDNEFRKEICAGALSANQTNVFIDGVSYKNDVIEGGVVGQDASRGNPFPQNAVQEFQVLTQNYKAEYEKAGSAIITAVTKSGGNRFTGDVFSLYQNKGLVQNQRMVRVGDVLDLQAGRAQADLRPLAVGLLGRRADRRRTRRSSSAPTRRTARPATPWSRAAAPRALRPPSLARIEAQEGLFESPFREKLLFAKASAQPRPRLAARSHLQLPQRDRHPRLRQPIQLRSRRERPQPRRLGARQVADRRRRATG